MAKSLVQGKHAAGDSGEPILWAFPQLDEARIAFRKGQLTLVGAAPGTGKSAWVFSALIIGYFRKILPRVLYLSADTDAALMYKRAAQVLTGWTASYIEECMGDDRAADIEEIVRAGTAHLSMVYESYPDADVVRDQVNAYYEIHGVFPDVIVMDNLKNLRLEDSGRGEEFDALEGNCEFLQLIARDTGAAVVTLHHVTGEYENGDKPIPLGGLRGKLGKTPEVVLTLFRDPQHLYVSAVKNRDGQTDPTGRTWVALNADLNTMSYS